MKIFDKKLEISKLFDILNIFIVLSFSYMYLYFKFISSPVFSYHSKKDLETLIKGNKSIIHPLDIQLLLLK